MLYVCELQLLVVTDFGVLRKHKGELRYEKDYCFIDYGYCVMWL